MMAQMDGCPLFIGLFGFRNEKSGCHFSYRPQLAIYLALNAIPLCLLPPTSPFFASSVPQAFQPCYYFGVPS
jgi:hypothetical protein